MIMSKNKIYDCITFFDENLLVNSRFEILDNVVDYFIVCESCFDHKGERKKIFEVQVDLLSLLLKNKTRILEVRNKTK